MHNIPTYFAISEPDDIITFQPGALFWAKAEGITNCSAWTLAEKTQNQCPFPLKNITLDFTNHEANYIDQDFLDLLVSKLNEFFKEDEKKMLHDQKFLKQPDEAQAVICNNCDVELFNHWACCQNYECEVEENQKIFYCLSCIKKHLKNCKSPTKICYYEKYCKKDYQQFLELLEDINQNGVNTDYCLFQKFCQGYLLKGEIATKCNLFHVHSQLLDLDAIYDSKVEENIYTKLQQQQEKEKENLENKMNIE